MEVSGKYCIIDTLMIEYWVSPGGGVNVVKKKNISIYSGNRTSVIKP
jgi:hypothetical protein